MQTFFTDRQLETPRLRSANAELRACVHCGMCNATCPTFLLLGDELDGPRGRIYLIKSMLEEDAVPSTEVVRHIDRCLSCLGCLTTCPSGVDYRRLIDTARAHIEARYRRPLSDRLLRTLLARLLPYPARFRFALAAARIAWPFARLLPRRFRAPIALAAGRSSARGGTIPTRTFAAEGTRRKRVLLMPGCVQNVLAPEINQATIRLLTRHGCDVVLADGAACCGALTHHLGHERDAETFMGANVRAISAEIDKGLDAVVVNASGCGAMVKDYGVLLAEDRALAEDALAVAALARDVSEVAAELDLRPAHGLPLGRVAYHSACALEHGQKIRETPKKLLRRVGFDVVEIPEGHICCGSAGSYNLLEPEIAEALRDRKAANIARTAPDIVATGNIGCMVQIAPALDAPVVHTVELLDWATGGPEPPALRKGRETRP